MRKLSFSKSEIPFILLFLTGVYVLFLSMANGKFGEMFSGGYLILITLFFYNMYPLTYTSNLNLLTWNVTTTMSALFKTNVMVFILEGGKW